MKLMKLTARSRKAFPNKSTKAFGGDTAMGRALAVKKEIHGSDVKAATNQSYPVKGVSVLKAVGLTAQKTKPSTESEVGAKKTTYLKEVAKLVVEQVKTQDESSGLNAPEASTPSHRPDVVGEPTTMTATSSPGTEATKIHDASHDTASSTLAIATQLDSANVHSISITDVLSEIVGIRIAMESIAQVLAESLKGKRARATGVSQIDPESLKSFEGKKLLDMPAVEALVGAKRSTIYGWIKEQRFVKPVKLSPKATRFVASEVADWLDAQKARGSDVSNPSSDLQR